MRSISQPFLRRPVFTIVCSLLVLLAGTVALVGLGLEDLPQLAPTRVSVSATFPAASPEVVEQSVTAVLEKQLNGLEGLESMTSSSRQGGASLSLRFQSGDPELNAIKVQNEVNLASRRLPQAVTRQGLNVNRSTDDLLLILGFSAPPGLYEPIFIGGWLDQNLREALRAVPGVGDIRVFGSSELAFRLWLDPNRLEQFNLSTNDVTAALAEQNVLAAVGSLGEAPAPAGQLFSLPIDAEGRLRNRADFEAMVVKRTEAGGLVRLKDVGRVQLGQRSYGSSTLNLEGNSSVAVGIFQRDGANALEVSGAVMEALKRLESSFPPSLSMQVIVDVAETVQANLDRTTGTLRDAVVLVLVVLVLFLGRWRLALIPGIAVPVALIGSLVVVRLSGSNLNSLILFGLVLATGIVVDDAIVVSEDIAGRIEDGAEPQGAAEDAMAELAGAVVATSLVLAAVFLPVLLIPGSIGRLYQPIALAISGAILFSTFNALTFTPMACARVLSSGSGRLPGPVKRISQRLRQGMRRLQSWYGQALALWLPRGRIVLGLILTGLMLTGIGLATIPTSFIPDEDQGQVRGYFTLPEGASLERTEAVMERIRQVIAEEPLIRSGNFYAGRSFGQSGEDRGAFYLRLAPLKERSGRENSSEAVKKRLNKALQRQITDARVIVTTPPTVRGFSSESGLQMQLLDRSGGQLSLQEFETQAQRFIRAAQDSGRFQRVSTRFDASSPRWRLEIDRTQMAALDLPVGPTLRDIGTAIGGRYIDDTFEGGQIRSIYVQLEGSDRSTPDDLTSLMVRNRSGELVSVANVARLKRDSGANSITHYNQNRSISIIAVPTDAVSSGQAIDLLQTLSDRTGGSNLALTFTGLAKEETRAESVSWVLFALGLTVVYLLLAGLYESFLDPLIILLTVPMALLGALIGLKLRGLTLDVYAQMGLLVLVSLAAKNGILIVEFANQRLEQGIPLFEAIEEAAINRMRPILLTAVTSLAGFLPLLLASGSGSASRISIGTVVFSGLLVSTLLSLFVIPAIYLQLKRWRGVGPSMPELDG
ncbi:MAG: efflux RND transporter permease subunit [Synechococcus sp.]|uniref:efflux RND transporter permease subunit n=1 Tax=Synechococcus sp. BMK-MC-1 TaxID=1442551 RepID=UPI001646E04D|nr:efflux RND transporter permease subunit [Synechococcus sp. BMK-MC-1]QNI66619.1 RND family multidrug efflux transporter [Synechococcus sp. BMK-MC-1]